MGIIVTHTKNAIVDYLDYRIPVTQLYAIVEYLD